MLPACYRHLAISARFLQDFSGHYGAAKCGKSARCAYECCQYREGLARYFDDVCDAVLQCLHDLRIILRFPCNACAIEQLSCFHLPAALKTSCDNGFFFVVFQIRPHGASSYVTGCTNIWNCRAVALCGLPTKNRAGAAYL